MGNKKMLSIFRAPLLRARFRQAHACRPLLKGMATSAVIGFAGDASAQWMEGVGQGCDQRRLAAMTLFSALYNGVVYANLFPMMDRHLTPARLRCGARGALVAKILVENLLHSPLVYFPVYYLAVGAMRGKPVEQIRREAEEQFVSSNIANCVMWIPATALCFTHVPVQHRLLFFNVVSFCWQNVLSQITNGSSDHSSTSGGRNCRLMLEAD